MITASYGCILEHVIRAGETYPLARDMSQAESNAYRIRPDRETLVTEENGCLVGTYYPRSAAAVRRWRTAAT